MQAWVRWNDATTRRSQGGSRTSRRAIATLTITILAVAGFVAPAAAAPATKVAVCHFDAVTGT